MKVSPLSRWRILLTLAVVGPLHAGSREAMLRVQAWLGPDVKTRLIRIENRPATASRYPEEFHALVIAFADILWLYNEYDGTQNLSARRGRLAEDEANLAALLRETNPGWVRFADDPGDAAAVRDTKRQQFPANGCFIACLARWQEMAEEARPPTRGRLLAYFVAGASSGHMVLEYARNGRRFIFDPDRPNEELRIPRSVGESAKEVATVITDARRIDPPTRAVAIEIRPLASPEHFLAGELPPGQSRS